MDWTSGLGEVIFLMARKNRVEDLHFSLLQWHKYDPWWGKCPFFGKKKLKIKLHVALQSRTKIASQTLTGSCDSPHEYTGIPASLPSFSPQSCFLWKVHRNTSTFHNRKSPLFFTTHRFVHTRRNYIVLKWLQEILKIFTVVISSAESYMKNFSWEALPKSGWILLKKFYLSF